MNPVPRPTSLLTVSVAALATLLLNACSTTAPAPEPAIEEPDSSAIQYRPFPTDTLYSLLVAEIAGSRERYDIALNNYLREAHKTRDPAVTARATRIARFLHASNSALDAALLWIQIEPNNPEARLIATSELAEAQRLEEALEQAKALQNLGHSAPFHHIAAQANNATPTQVELLISNFKELRSLYPDSRELLLGLAILQQYNDQLEAGLLTARQYLQRYPDDIPATIVEARILQRLKRPQEALSRMAAMLRKHPDNKRLRLQYARILTSYDLEQAHEQFQILSEQSPEDADLLFSLALVSSERGLLDQARAHFEKLLAMDKRSSAAHYYLGRLDQREGLYDSALKHYLAVQPGQDFLPAISKASALLLMLQRYDESHEVFNTLHRRFPSESQQFYLLEAKLLNQAQQYQRAYEVLTQALSSKPSDPELLYTRAIIAEKLYGLPGLENDLRTLLRYDPNNVSALNALGYSLAVHTNRIEEAKVLIGQALKLRPEDPAIIDSMGWVEYRNGNYDSALRLLEKAMAAMPDHEIAAHLGEVLWVIGEKTKAKEIWLKGLELNPDSEIIPSTMKRLKAVIEQSE